MAELTLTDQTFKDEVKNTQELFIVDLWADWCMPCKMIAPILSDLATKYQGKMTVGKLNVDEYPSVAQELGVTGIPTVLIFKKGELVDKVVGALPQKMFEQKFMQYMD